MMMRIRTDAAAAERERSVTGLMPLIDERVPATAGSWSRVTTMQPTGRTAAAPRLDVPMSCPGAGHHGTPTNLHHPTWPSAALQTTARLPSSRLMSGCPGWDIRSKFRASGWRRSRVIQQPRPRRLPPARQVQWRRWKPMNAGSSRARGNHDRGRSPDGERFVCPARVASPRQRTRRFCPAFGAAGIQPASSHPETHGLLPKRVGAWVCRPVCPKRCHRSGC